MHNYPPLSTFIFTCTLLGLLLYGSIHLAFAQPIADDPLLHSRIEAGANAAALPQSLFQPAKSFALAERPDAEAVGIGDFNHDGYQDVAVTAGTYAPNYLYIFLQGEEGQLQTPELYPADVEPEALAVGDLNGDGWDDVAVVSVADNRVAVYLQTREGKLAERKLYVTERTPDAIAIADFNRDGRDDVVVSHSNHPSVGLLLQQEDGTLADRVLYAAPQAGNDDIDIGDVNGDDLPDVVKLNGQGLSADLSVLLQTISGTLELPLPHDISGAITKSGVAVGDVTGDGRADVVATHYGDTSDPFRYKVSLFAQQIDGTLDLVQGLLANTNVEPIEIADVNGDGRNDVIACGDIRLLVYLQLSDGTLAPFQEYQVPYASHLHPQTLDVGDINGDGLLDVVIANYNAGLVVLYHALPGTPTVTPTPTATVTPTPTATATPTTTPIATPEPVNTPTSSPTAWATPIEVTPTSNSAFVFMPLIAAAATPTATPTPSPTATPSPTPATPSDGPVAFSATTLCEHEAAQWEYAPVTYAYGKRLLDASFTFVNQIGRNWRIVWSYNGQSRPALDQSGIVSRSPELVVVEIFYGATGACQLPLPRGVYEAQIYLDNVLWQQGTATIQ